MLKDWKENEHILSGLEKLFSAVAKNPSLAILIGGALVHSVYWLTAWLTPLIFLAMHGWSILKMLRGNTGWAGLIRLSLSSKVVASMLIGLLVVVLLDTVALFACLYMFTEIGNSDGELLNGSWNHFYFSAVTLTTLGYGDWTPLTAGAEFVAIAEALLGFLGFAVIAGIAASISLSRISQLEPSSKIIDPENLSRWERFLATGKWDREKGDG